MDTIELDELREALQHPDDVRVVMALGTHRYAQAHIPGSETFATIDEALEELRPDEHIVLYCTGGPCHASRWAYRLLRSRGYDHVRVYTDGLIGWDAAQLPLAGEMAA